MHEYYFNHAENVAEMSKDPSKKVGAIITFNGLIYAHGYNKFPIWFDNEKVKFLDKELKGKLIIHAEVSALDNLMPMYWHEDLIMYVTCFPCYYCASYIVNSKVNIKEIHIKKQDLSEDFIKRYRLDESKELLNKHGIEVIEHEL